MQRLELDMPVQYVKGVGPARAGQLAKAGIETVEDLMMYFPRRFNLRRQVQPISSLGLIGRDSGIQGDEDLSYKSLITVAGIVQETRYQPYGSRPYFQCSMDDGTGWVVVKWFHGGYLKDRIKPGVGLIVSGKVSVYKETFQFINPRFEILHDSHDVGYANYESDELLPVYLPCGKLPGGLIGRIIKQILPEVDRLFPRWFDADYLRRRDLLDRPTAISAMHRPEDRDTWKRARKRLVYDEFLLMQLGIAIQRERYVSRPAYPLPVSQGINRRIRARFPFEFTAGQNRAIRDISADLSRNHPMNRLLQGDVGSGKTVVALYAALVAVAHRKQAAIMAPTEILARQHFAKISQYLSGSRVRIALLIGATRPTDREEILEGLADGRIDIVVGTHALLSENVRFHSLAVTVVDEQHKFGVRQRSWFRAKGHAPHCLVMTATPIPRTLALTVFGDLQLSVIDDMPPGRGRTETILKDKSRMDEVIEFVRGRLAVGQQAYFVTPLVTETGGSGLSSVRSTCEELTRCFPDYTVGMVHGQMPADQQESVMSQFSTGRIRLLVASTVVEVGLDVPDANVMVILDADRFGLAQLHQLRGRIGRGKSDAVCILVAKVSNPLAAERLKILLETNDGFKIAQEDLRLRGPGEFFGTRQHGLPELKIADLIDDADILMQARRDAFEIIRNDPDLSAPEHQQLRLEMIKTYGDRIDLIQQG